MLIQWCVLGFVLMSHYLGVIAALNEIMVAFIL